MRREVSEEERARRALLKIPLPVVTDEQAMALGRMVLARLVEHMKTKPSEMVGPNGYDEVHLAAPLELAKVWHTCLSVPVRHAIGWDAFAMTVTRRADGLAALVAGDRKAKVAYIDEMEGHIAAFLNGDEEEFSETLNPAQQKVVDAHVGRLRAEVKALKAALDHIATIASARKKPKP